MFLLCVKVHDAHADVPHLEHLAEACFDFRSVGARRDNEKMVNPGDDVGPVPAASALAEYRDIPKVFCPPILLQLCITVQLPGVATVSHSIESSTNNSELVANDPLKKLRKSIDRWWVPVGVNVRRVDEGRNRVERDDDVLQTDHAAHEAQKQANTNHGNHRADRTEEVVLAVLLFRSIANKSSFKLFRILAFFALLRVQPFFFSDQPDIHGFATVLVQVLLRGLVEHVALNVLINFSPHRSINFRLTFRIDLLFIY
jgi:hypothetical protein